MVQGTLLSGSTTSTGTDGSDFWRGHPQEAREAQEALGFLWKQLWKRARKERER